MKNKCSNDHCMTNCNSSKCFGLHFTVSPALILFLLSLLSIVMAASEKNLISQFSNKLSWDLYEKMLSVQKPLSGNLIFSPFSIHTALSMTRHGAKGNTQVEMNKVLHFPDDAPQIDILAENFSDLLKSFKSEDKSYTLHQANKLFAQQGYSILEEFTSALNKVYQAELGLLDFSRDPESARNEINSWVESETRNKISNLIAPGVLNNLVRAVLVNAIYFKGVWLKQFNAEETSDMPFNTAANNTVDVKMMSQKGTFKVAVDHYLKVRALELPYTKNQLSMFIVLPDELCGLEQVEARLTASKLSSLVATARPYKDTRIMIPRFKLEHSFSLPDVLKALGLRDLFSAETCDLSGVTGNRDLFVSDVIHKAFVEVNEEGSEAAAATAVVMMMRSMAHPPPMQFIANHPFLFFIRDNPSGTILFMGRIQNPVPEPKQGREQQEL